MCVHPVRRFKERKMFLDERQARSQIEEASVALWRGSDDWRITGGVATKKRAFSLCLLERMLDVAAMGGWWRGGRWWTRQRRDFAIPLKELLWVVVVVSHGHGRKLSTDNRIYKPQSQAKYASLSD